MQLTGIVADIFSMSVPGTDLSADQLRRMLAAISSKDPAGDLTMRIWIAAHPNVPHDWVDKVLGLRFVAARRFFEQTFSVAGLPVRINAARDSGVYRALASNPSLTQDQLRRVWHLRPMFSYPGSAVTCLAKNANTPPDVIESITMFMLNKMSPPHGSWPLPALLIAHPNQTDRAGKALTDYLLSITEHPDCGTHAVRALIPLAGDPRTAAWMSAEDQSRLLVSAAFLL